MVQDDRCVREGSGEFSKRGELRMENPSIEGEPKFTETGKALSEGRF